MSDLLTRLRDYGAQLDAYATPLEDLTPLRLPTLEDTRRGARGWLYAVAAAVAVLVLVGGLALLVPGPATEREPVAPSTTSPTLDFGDVRGLAGTADGVLWAWDRDGNIAAYVDGAWVAIPPLDDAVVDITGRLGDTWAITSRRCDPTVPDRETMVCDTSLWRLSVGRWNQVSDGLWDPLSELGNSTVPDNLQDIDIGSTGDLLIATADGDLYLRDSDGQLAWWVESGRMNIDSVAQTEDAGGAVTIWASRFNPYFPDDIGFARHSGSGWTAFGPLDAPDGANHHAVMASTPGGDLWVWFSEFPSDSSTSGKALGFYDGAANQWTIHERGIPEGPARAMAASDESVWLVSLDGRLWRFEGEAWTLLIDLRISEDALTDVAVAGDGTVWYVAGDALRRVQA